MKNTKVFRAWCALDEQSNRRWQPDQIDVWLALIAGVFIGAFLGASV